MKIFHLIIFLVLVEATAGTNLSYSLHVGVAGLTLLELHQPPGNERVLYLNFCAEEAERLEAVAYEYTKDGRCLYTFANQTTRMFRRDNDWRKVYIRHIKTDNYTCPRDFPTLNSWITERVISTGWAEWSECDTVVTCGGRIQRRRYKFTNNHTSLPSYEGEERRLCNHKVCEAPSPPCIDDWSHASINGLYACRPNDPSVLADIVIN